MEEGKGMQKNLCLVNEEDVRQYKEVLQGWNTAKTQRMRSRYYVLDQ